MDMLSIYDDFDTLKELVLGGWVRATDLKRALDLTDENIRSMFEIKYGNIKNENIIWVRLPLSLSALFSKIHELSFTAYVEYASGYMVPQWIVRMSDINKLQASFVLPKGGWDEFTVGG